MSYELKVSLQNIIPLTYARDHFSNIVGEVQKDKLYILTKGGKPAVAIIDVRYLEQLTGGQFRQTQVKEEIDKNPEQVGLPKMVDHTVPPAPTPQFTPSKVEGPKPAFTPPPPFRKTFTPPPPKPAPITPAPIAPPASRPTPPPVPAPPPKFTPSKVEGPKPMTPPPPPPTPPVTPPPAGSLIMPGQDATKNSPPPANTSSDAKIEIQFDTDKDDLDGSDSSAQKRIDPGDIAPAAQYAGSSDNKEPEEMAID